MPKLQLGVLVSGNGTNLQAIVDAIAQGRLNAEVRLVISNKPGVKALERAQRAGVHHQCVSHREFPDRESFDRRLIAELRAAGCEWIALAGFMRLLTPAFLAAFPDRIINVHPALCPAFPGVRAQRQALEYGVKLTGCTIHLVDEGMDTGPIVAQKSVPVLETDDEASLSQRIHEVEYELYVDALIRIAEGGLSVVETPGGRKRVVLGAPSQENQ